MGSVGFGVQVLTIALLVTFDLSNLSRKGGPERTNKL